MRSFFIIIFITYQITSLNSQTPHSNSELPLSINEDGAAPDKTAIVDIQSQHKGLLIPRMPYYDIEQITAPAEGLMIYDTEFHCLRIYIQGAWHCLYQRMSGPDAVPTVTGWANPTYDEDWNNGIAIDSEENIYVTMETEDSETRLRKFDNKGNILWDIFEDPGSEMRLPVVDQNDNVFVTGTGPSFNGVSVAFDNYIAKTVPDGSSSEVYSLPGADISDMAVDYAGNLIFVFTFNQVTFNGTTYTDITGDNILKVGVAKLDNNLNELWLQVLDVYNSGNYYLSEKVAVDTDNNIYVGAIHENGVGHYSIPAADIKNSNIFVSKLANSNGTHIWTRSFGTDLDFTEFHVAWGGGTVFAGGIQRGASYSDSDVIIKAYNDTYNIVKATLEPEGKEDWFNFTANATTGELAVTFIPREGSNWYYNPAKLLIYNSSYTSIEEPRIYDQTFSLPGKLTFNNSGSVIYGIGNGTQVGNASITNNGEGHIIFKFLNQ